MHTENLAEFLLLLHEKDGILLDGFLCCKHNVVM